MYIPCGSSIVVLPLLEVSSGTSQRGLNETTTVGQGHPEDNFLDLVQCLSTLHNVRFSVLPHLGAPLPAITNSSPSPDAILGSVLTTVLCIFRLEVFFFAL